MYCKKCHTLLEESSAMCPNCYYDNNLDIQNDQTMEFKAIKIEGMNKKPKINIRPITIIIFIMLICATLIIIYMIKDKKNIHNKEITTTIITTTVNNANYNSFKYKNIEMKYSDNFGASANTIFYKQNSNINIEINTIDETEYNNILNLDETEILTDKLGNIETKTLANENNYQHLFIYNNEYYNIKVNFISDDNIYDGNAQMEISKILNSIIEK